jgi:glucosamine-6-phosphate deaminase
MPADAGGQGEIKHWVVQRPAQARGRLQGCAAFSGRVPQAVRSPGGPAPRDDHPEREDLVGGNVAMVPTRAATVGPVETWKAAKSVDQAPGPPRQPLRHPAFRAEISMRIPGQHVPMSCSRIIPMSFQLPAQGQTRRSRWKCTEPCGDKDVRI